MTDLGVVRGQVALQWSPPLFARVIVPSLVFAIIISIVQVQGTPDLGNGTQAAPIKSLNPRD